jgi:DNA-binding transcriptional ArsR family regulator
MDTDEVMMEPTDALSETFAALADPTRRAILARLAQGEATVNELAEPFDLKLPTISKHLKVLQKAGLISQGRKAQWRPCRLEPAPLKGVADWVERYRQMWEERLGRLDDYLAELQALQAQQQQQQQQQNPSSAQSTESTQSTPPADEQD